MTMRLSKRSLSAQFSWFPETQGKGLLRLRKAGDGALYLLLRVLHREARGHGQGEVQAEPAEGGHPDQDSYQGQFLFREASDPVSRASDVDLALSRLSVQLQQP